MLPNPSLVSATIAVGTVAAHTILYVINRRVEARLEKTENRIVATVQGVKDWTMEHFVPRAARVYPEMLWVPLRPSGCGV